MATKGTYHAKDAVAQATNSAMIAGAAGLTMSAVQNSLSRQNYGALGVFTRTGSTIGLFAIVGGGYEFARCASANLRQKDDAINTAIGGFVGGAVLGLRFRTLPAVLGLGAMTSIVLGVFDYTGGKFSGYDRDEGDEFERKQHLRKDRRKPITETLEELGEGRGIYGPGYQERRRERIKEAYGIDVGAGQEAKE